MALKALIHKVEIQLSDIDRGIYGDFPLTVARHPSETDVRLMVRLLAFALNVPTDSDHGPLELAKDMWEADAPALWQKDFTDRVLHWIDVGEPDERRLLRMSARVDRVTVYGYASSTATWWKGVEPGLTRTRNITVWQLPPEQGDALAVLVQRTMALQVTVQEGGIWVGDGTHSIEVSPIKLRAQ